MRIGAGSTRPGCAAWSIWRNRRSRPSRADRLPRDGADAKSRLRIALAERRRHVPPVEAARAGAARVAAALEEPRVRFAARVALYAASDCERLTRALFDALGLLSIERMLPRVEGDVLAWGAVRDWDALVAGPFGILEPRSEATVLR